LSCLSADRETRWRAYSCVAIRFWHLSQVASADLDIPVLGLTNMLPSIEQHVEWVADCIGYLREKGLSRIEAQAEAEENWVAHVREVAGASLRSTCSS
jgi:hypothetical protein